MDRTQSTTSQLAEVTRVSHSSIIRILKLTKSIRIKEGIENDDRKSPKRQRIKNGSFSAKRIFLSINFGIESQYQNHINFSRPRLSKFYHTLFFTHKPV